MTSPPGPPTRTAAAGITAAAEAGLARAETAIADEVAAVLTDVADEFTGRLGGATELVAAIFSVSAIARMWRKQVPRLVARFLGASETAAHHTADQLDTDLPDGWDDLPGKYEAGGPLPAGLGQYVTTTESLLVAVGSRIAAAARDELAAGLDAGETVPQLRDRLRVAFAREGAALGDNREASIAQTEATRAWNAGTLAAARALTGPDRPLAKQWVTRDDERVRPAHQDADRQIRFLDRPFTVGGASLQYPGDPSAPPSQTVRCRCRLDILPGTTAAAVGVLGDRPRTQHRNEALMPEETTAAAGGQHTGAMIALVPTEEDAARLALSGGEHPSELHLTLWFLGEGADWDQDQRNELTANVRAFATSVVPGPVTANAFGANHWNAGTDEPSWVWAVGDDRDRPADAPALYSIRDGVTRALEDLHSQPELPVQHSPWVPHVCAVYTGETWPLPELEARLGPITFDRIRLAFADEYTDIPLGPTEEPRMDDQPDGITADAMPTRTWATPDPTGLAFEDTETGDGRIFAPGALHWGAGPWPLQYADEMLMGHEGAELAGAIQQLGRDGHRITATGVLYSSRPAGADAAALLDAAAPLGVSVDLDDIDVEFVDRSDGGDEGEVLFLAASLPSASLIGMSDGAYMLTVHTAPAWTASGTAFSRTRTSAQLITGPGGTLTAAAVRQALEGTGAVTAAAGDPDTGDAGTVVHAERSGELLMRITRGRVRGATLVAVPAFDQARIVLDPADDGAAPPPASAADEPGLAAAMSDTHRAVIEHVTGSPVPVRARDVAEVLGLTIEQARGHLVRAAEEGLIVRLAPGQYVGVSTLPEGTEVTAALAGDLDLPVHPDRDAEWDGDAAASRVLAWATGEDGTVDADRLGRAFLYRDPDADPGTLAAYKLGFADVRDDELVVVARGVFAVAAALQGARGGVDVPGAERDELRDRVEDLYERLAGAFDDPALRAPWDSDNTDDEDEDEGMRELEASAWSAVRQAPPMPAGWFREPTLEELPPGSGGVHYADGRIYGWVAQAGEPHAGFPGRNLTIESLGDIDLSHFLRARFQLDDGSTVRAGAFTMNAPHHRDGAECESAACQFDDTRTVAGIVTVGMNERGMWFSGAAAPHMSDWDRQVFTACQPSYHMRQGRDGRWQLRAVLSVPVPGHSSPLVAAVVERSNLALAASAAATDSPAAPDHPHPADSPQAPVLDVDALTAALTAPAFLDRLADALDRRRAERDAETRAEIERLNAAIAPARHLITASINGTKGGSAGTPS